MAFHVRDPETDTLVRELALKRGVGITDAVKLAVSAELAREADEPARRMAAIRKIQDDIARRRVPGFKADKAFFDWLSGEEDV